MTSLLMLCRGIIVVYCENRLEHVRTLCGQKADVPFGLFEGDVSSSEYRPSNTKIINDWRMGNHVEGISLT
jgi:hypothetical protein